MESSNDPVAANQAAESSGTKRKAKRWRYHQKAYLGLLIFVVIAGMPIIAVPSLRMRLRTRTQVLRAAALGEAPVQPSITATVGANREPFPKEYFQAAARPSYLPKLETPPRASFRITVGGDEPPATMTVGDPGASAKTRAQTADAGQAGAADARPSAGASGGESQYRKGTTEQEAYDLLLGANQILAGMLKGSDPALKYQDWGAAHMGQDSYYVMVSFVQISDNTVRKYIWNVKLATKEVVALSSYAREISK